MRQRRPTRAERPWTSPRGCSSIGMCPRPSSPGFSSKVSCCRCAPWQRLAAGIVPGLHRRGPVLPLNPAPPPPMKRVDHRRGGLRHQARGHRRDRHRQAPHRVHLHRAHRLLPPTSERTGPHHYFLGQGRCWGDRRHPEPGEVHAHGQHYRQGLAPHGRGVPDPRVAPGPLTITASCWKHGESRMAGICGPAHCRYEAPRRAAISWRGAPGFRLPPRITFPG